jgi:hypothetical protein
LRRIDRSPADRAKFDAAPVYRRRGMIARARLAAQPLEPANCRFQRRAERAIATSRRPLSHVRHAAFTKPSAHVVKLPAMKNPALTWSTRKIGTPFWSSARSARRTTWIDRPERERRRCERRAGETARSTRPAGRATWLYSRFRAAEQERERERGR